MTSPGTRQINGRRLAIREPYPGQRGWLGRGLTRPLR
jgi:hypothetical protein